MSFLAELKRRNVVRVGIVYAVIGWFLAQVTEFAFENFDAPPWVLKSFVVVLLLGLPVAGRTSSFSFKGKNEDLRAIGTTLNVANILEGSVRRQGDKVRVTAQRIRADDGYHSVSGCPEPTWIEVAVGIGYAEALAFAPVASEDLTFFGMSAYALPLAISGDVDAARVAMEQSGIAWPMGTIIKYPAKDW
jgi:hypothetical protein